MDSEYCAFIGNRAFKGCYVFLIVSSELLVRVVLFASKSQPNAASDQALGLYGKRS
jgi:hypothetical protein